MKIFLITHTDTQDKMRLETSEVGIDRLPSPGETIYPPGTDRIYKVIDTEYVDAGRVDVIAKEIRTNSFDRPPATAPEVDESLRKQKFDALDAYRQSLQETIGSCEKESDYRTTYISGGAIALTLAFIASENFDHPICWTLLIAGILLEIAAIVMNLWSFIYTKQKCRKDMQLVDEMDRDMPVENIPQAYDISLDRAKAIDRYNLINIVLLTVGIVLLTLFVGINVYNTGKSAPQTDKPQAETTAAAVRSNPTDSLQYGQTGIETNR